MWDVDEVFTTVPCDGEGRFDFWTLSWRTRNAALSHAATLRCGRNVGPGHVTPEGAYPVRLAARGCAGAPREPIDSASRS
jgi:hypothetical protein